MSTRQNTACGKQVKPRTDPSQALRKQRDQIEDQLNAERAEHQINMNIMQDKFGTANSQIRKLTEDFAVLQQELFARDDEIVHLKKLLTLAKKEGSVEKELQLARQSERIDAMQSYIDSLESKRRSSADCQSSTNRQKKRKNSLFDGSSAPRLSPTPTQRSPSPTRRSIATSHGGEMAGLYSIREDFKVENKGRQELRMPFLSRTIDNWMATLRGESEGCPPMRFK